MSTNPYPDLGFNPVPGTPADVEALRTRIDAARQGVTETRILLNRLVDNDDVWQGEAGDAFRANFDATLSSDLGRAQQSLEEAVDLLGQWHTNLVSFHESAGKLEREATDARAQHAQANVALAQAKIDPDLKLAGLSFSDPGDLQVAQARLNAAISRLQTATSTVDAWQDRINDILRRAKELEGIHANLAGRIAAGLDAAANFAPAQPDKSIWDHITDAVEAIGEWIDEHREGLYNALSITAAIAGLLAVVTPPPISAVALGVALVAGAGALGLTLTNDDIQDDLLNGDLGDRLGAGLTITGDALSLVPGLGALGKAGKVALLGDEAADIGRFEGMARAWSEGAHNPGFVNKFLTDHNVGKVTDALSSSGVTNGVNRLLQFTGVEGAHSVADPAVALTVLKRGEGVLASIAGPMVAGVFGD